MLQAILASSVALQKFLRHLNRLIYKALRIIKWTVVFWDNLRLLSVPCNAESTVCIPLKGKVCMLFSGVLSWWYLLQSSWCSSVTQNQIPKIMSSHLLVRDYFHPLSHYSNFMKNTFTWKNVTLLNHQLWPIESMGCCLNLAEPCQLNIFSYSVYLTIMSWST